MTMRADFALPAVEESSLRYDGWRVTAVCFVVAMFCWGFGLYRHGIYLAELQRLFGWSASLISGATTAYYLLTASLVVFISDAIVRLGPRRVFLLGTCCLGSAVRSARFHCRTLAALPSLSHHGGGIGGDARRRDHQRSWPVVRSPARACDQPGAQRRELRRHLRRADPQRRDCRDRLRSRHGRGSDHHGGDSHPRHHHRDRPGPRYAPKRQAFSFRTADRDRE